MLCMRRVCKECNHCNYVRELGRRHNDLNSTPVWAGAVGWLQLSTRICIYPIICFTTPLVTTPRTEAPHQVQDSSPHQSYINHSPHLRSCHLPMSHDCGSLGCGVLQEQVMVGVPGEEASKLIRRNNTSKSNSKPAQSRVLCLT